MRLILVIAAVVSSSGCGRRVLPPAAPAGALVVPSVDADSTTLRRRLGAPLSATRRFDPHDTNGTLRISAKYADLTLLLDARGRPEGVQLTTARYSTYRGLRVGDDSLRMVQLYGQPRERIGTALLLLDRDPDGWRPVVRLEASRVADILLVRQ